MANLITNTPLKKEAYDHWGLILNNIQNKNLARMADGTLWAVVAPHFRALHIMKSIDNGFTWTTVRYDGLNDGVHYLNYRTDYNYDGPNVALMVNELYGILYVIYHAYDSVGPTNSIILRRYDLSTITTDTEATINTNQVVVDSDMFQGVFDTCYNDNDGFVTFIDTGENKISCKEISPRTGAVGGKVTLGTTPVFNLHGSCVDKDGKVSIVFTHQTGGKNIVKWATYYSRTGWGTPVTIVDFGDTNNEARDISVAYDGYGTICAFWTKVQIVTNAVTLQYAISKDLGATWTVVDLVRTATHTKYTDLATSDPAGRTQIIGSQDNGFMLSYCEDSSTASNAIPKTYVRQLSTTNGTTYTLGAEKQIATDRLASEAIVGAHFFYPSPQSRLMDFADPGLVRVAYTIGDAAETTGDDDAVVIFGQELLSSSAFPSTLTTENNTYTMEGANYNTVLVTLEILGGPGNIINYYSYGMTGTYTDRYLAAFERIGNSVRFLKYEPDSDNQMNDRSAYGAPADSSCKVIMVPRTYGRPTPDLISTSQPDWVEQDIRKLYLPPDFHIDRTYLVNQGGFLKRTVWLLEFNGVYYEVTQVVPYFMDNQICYYDANLYAMGPNRDPFSREIIPNEP